MNQVVGIVGPTAIGKSELALFLAQQLDGELANADSRQVYRYMDIGTAKPSPEERASVPHHLIDLIEPSDTFSLALFQRLAYAAIEDILSRGKLPLLIGGTGLYFWAVVEAWHVPEVSPNPDRRRRLEEIVAEQGVEPLYHQLQELDPEAARKIDPRNVRRVIRALEVCEATNTPFSQLQGKKQAPFDTLILGLTTSREELYRRIDERADRMIEQGLVAEVETLAKMGYGFDLPAMSSLGYKQIGQYLQGEIDLPTAIRQMKFQTHRFARHQYAWFHLNDPRIHWLDIQDDFRDQVLRLAREGLANK